MLGLLVEALILGAITLGLWKRLWESPADVSGALNKVYPVTMKGLPP